MIKSSLDTGPRARDHSIMKILIALSVFASAKIADPGGIAGKDRFFCSHGNQVFAVKTSDTRFNCGSYVHGEKGAPKRVWKTTLPFRTGPAPKDPKLESDVQLCIVSSLSLEKDDLIATDCRGNRYVMSQKTGALYKKR